MLRENLNNMSQSIAGYLTNVLSGNTQASYNDMVANGMDVPMIRKEGFSDTLNMNNQFNSVNKASALGSFIALIIWLAIILWFGEYLFNHVLVKVIPAIKPITSVWQLLGLSLLFNMLF